MISLELCSHGLYQKWDDLKWDKCFCVNEHCHSHFELIWFEKNKWMKWFWMCRMGNKWEGNHRSHWPQKCRTEETDQGGIRKPIQWKSHQALWERAFWWFWGSFLLPIASNLSKLLLENSSNAPFSVFLISFFSFFGGAGGCLRESGSLSHVQGYEAEIKQLYSCMNTGFVFLIWSEKFSLLQKTCFRLTLILRSIQN